MKIVTGIDIGGTKTAVSFGTWLEDPLVLTIHEETRFSTPVHEPNTAVAMIIDTVRSTLHRRPVWKLAAVGPGRSCNSPPGSFRRAGPTLQWCRRLRPGRVALQSREGN